jgi:uncharacterized protein (DUF2237 family)
VRRGHRGLSRVQQGARQRSVDANAGVRLSGPEARRPLCLCAARWQEALDAGMAPRVVLRSTHERALEQIALADLKRYALDLA